MLKIYTAKEEFVFEGADAENVYKAVNSAGAGGANWSVPVKLESGKFIFFVLSNIIAIEYT